MTRFVELNTPTGERVFINPDQVTQLIDKDDVTHPHYNSNSSGSALTAVHPPIREVAALLSSD